MKTETKAQPFGLHQYIPTELFNREIFVYNVEYEKSACWNIVFQASINLWSEPGNCVLDLLMKMHTLYLHNIHF